MKDPATAPVPYDVFRTLVEKPFGEARNEIRKYDPLWGRREGEKIEFEVTCRSTMEGRAIVKAATQEEADALANKLTDAEVDWDCCGDCDFEILSVEPHRSCRTLAETYPGLFRKDREKT